VICVELHAFSSVTTPFAASGANNEDSMLEKGPPVYLDYDQAALDAAYDQAAYAPNGEQLIKRRISDSKLARLCVGEPECVAYGPAEIEQLDIYRTRRATAPAFVFIHGGAWRSGRSKDFATPAEMSSPPERIMSSPTSPG
jgi:arylformamidase